jgi:hypothetical protein
MAYLVEFFEGEGAFPYWRGLFSELEEVAARVPGWIRFKQRQHHKMEVAAAAAAGRAEPKQPALYKETVEDLIELFKVWPRETKELYSYDYYYGSWGSSLKVMITWVELFAGEPVTESEEE